MRPFPPAAHLQFFIGASFAQISLDPYSLQFQLDNGGGLFVEGRIEQITPTDEAHTYDCAKRDNSALYLHQILLDPIIEVKTEPLCLSLIFTSGTVLRIFSEIGPHECGQIFAPGDGTAGIIF